MITVHTNSDGALIEVELSGASHQRRLFRCHWFPRSKLPWPSMNTIPIRLLVIVQPEFKGYDLGAAWSDTKLGLSHWRGFDRIAVVADQGWVQTSIRLAAPILPCPTFRCSRLAELEAARRWMRESLGSIHVTDLGRTHVFRSAFWENWTPMSTSRPRRDLDALLHDRSGFRLLIDLREFDGWQGLSALAAHFRLASRNHIGQLDRAAIVGDKSWQHMAQRVASHVLGTRTQFFPSEEIENAKTWLAAG